MIIEEMRYGRDENLIHVLAKGEYKGHKYTVRSYGTHPCCYISLDGKKAINIDSIVCHGGVSYCSEHLPCETAKWGEDIWWIGWDYALFGDYVGWHSDSSQEKRWTTEELEKECLEVIDQLEGKDGRST